MPNERSFRILLVMIVILLLAILIRPILNPSSAFALNDDPKETVAITGTGTVAWVLKGNKIYYLKFETQFETIRVYGPEELE